MVNAKGRNFLLGFGITFTVLLAGILIVLNF